MRKILLIIINVPANTTTRYDSSRILRFDVFYMFSFKFRNIYMFSYFVRRTKDIRKIYAVARFIILVGLVLVLLLFLSSFISKLIYNTDKKFGGPPERAGQQTHDLMTGGLNSSFRTKRSSALSFSVSSTDSKGAVVLKRTIQCRHQPKSITLL